MVQDVSGTWAASIPLELSDRMLTGGCGSFYAITIASQSFNGLSIVKQHKLVTETLKQEIEGIHGLQVCVLLNDILHVQNGCQIKTIAQ